MLLDRSAACDYTIAMVKKKVVTKVATKRTKKKRADRVDYYPNKMTLAVSVLAGTSLMLFGLLAAITISNR